MLALEKNSPPSPIYTRRGRTSWRPTSGSRRPVDSSHGGGGHQQTLPDPGHATKPRAGGASGHQGRDAEKPPKGRNRAIRNCFGSQSRHEFSHTEMDAAVSARVSIREYLREPHSISDFGGRVGFFNGFLGEKWPIGHRIRSRFGNE